MPNHPSKPRNTIYTLGAALLLGILYAQAITSIPHLSMTSDEDLHVASGYSALRTGDLRLIEEHPELIKFWMTWPLLLSSQFPDPRQVPGWKSADLPFFVHSKEWRSIPLDSWVIPCRILIPLLALLLGAFLFRWASDWFGPRAGLFALALLAFDPNILAHATVATIDLGTTCFIFIAMYGLQRLLRWPSRANLIGAGIALGLALSAKISALILLPISIGLILGWGLARWRKLPAIRILAYLSIAGVTVWAVHRFEFGTPPEFSVPAPPFGLWHPQEEGKRTIDIQLSFPIPAPSYLRPFTKVGRHVLKDTSMTFLLGESFYGRRWYFFPVVFALKTPLPALILTVIALLFALLRPQQRWRELVLAILPVSYLGTSLLSSIYLGYRHLLPILPFMYLFIARLAGSRAGKDQPVKQRTFLRWSATLALVSLVIWQAISALQIWPFYLTFFNEIAGGPRNGYRYLADSNVDWGQGLKALGDYLEERGWNNVQTKLSSYTLFIRPARYGINATPLPPLVNAPSMLPTRFNPAPGTYIISASTLRGLQLQTTDPEMYNWFWHREPDDIVANAMLVYHVTERTPKPTWVAQCTTPVTPLETDQIEDGFGQSDLRVIGFDCATSWLYPTGGKSPGWFALSRDAPAWTQRYLGVMRLSYEQKRAGFSPPFRIYEDEGHASWPQGGQAHIAPSALALREAVATPPLELPVTFDSLTLLGYTLDRPTLKPGETTLLETIWRVESVPERLLSVMVHVLGPDGRVVAQGDGLGVPIESWQLGDVFVQRHSLTLPQAVSPGVYWIQTGVYWLDDGERWPARDQRATGDRALLVPLEIHP